MKAKALVILAAVILLVSATAYWRVQKGNEPGQHDDFAKCLSAKGAIMYGAYWCPHCMDQKEMFGNSWKHVNYIECSLPNKAGQTDFCKRAGINGYPTWEFSDESRVEQVMTLEQLGDKTGCTTGGLNGN